ncbi:MAG: nucleotidyltransferase domain-containing protein [Oscillospiraceae bacterium]|nr:nucleotidyltransferase domain-containing protein [Oscillospiraceae bacterium]
MDSENLRRLRGRANFFTDELSGHIVLKKYWDSLSLVLKGSTARGYSDQYSDIDFVVYTDQATQDDIVAEYISNGLSDRKDSVFLPLNNWEGHYNTDTYENVAKHFFNKNMMKVWECSNVMIMHDSHGRYEETIRKNTDRLFSGIDSLIMRKYFDIQLHLDWMRHPLKRADINAALQYASHLHRYCCHMMYLLNSQSYPNEKWLFYYLKETGIPDSLYSKLTGYGGAICETSAIKPDLELGEYSLYAKMADIAGDIADMLKLRYGHAKWIDEWYLYAE